MDKMFPCNLCNAVFVHRPSLFRHIRNDHGKKQIEGRETKKRLKCASCDEFLMTYKQYHNHLRIEHNEEIVEETLTFNNKAEFLLWKKDMENKQQSSYVLDTAPKKLKSGTEKFYYFCHRSLNAKPAATKRPGKKMGTNKIGAACSSRMVVDVTPTVVNVRFVAQHVGHSAEMGRQRLHKSERDQIAEKLSLGIPFEVVLDDVLGDVPEFQRVHLLTKKDLHNIKRDYKIGNGRGHYNDGASVHRWVQETLVKKPRTIIHYKEQGVVADGLGSDDFFLLFATPFQKDQLIAYGHDKVCVDGMHGTNIYGFQLFALLVVDCFGNDIPAVFCLSNRRDKDLFNLMFSKLREKFGVIPAKIFMSDDYPTCYNAWISVMGAPKHRLLCSWDVNKNWNKHLTKIEDGEKREVVKQSLAFIREEPNQNDFLAMWFNLLIDLEQDDDTKAFHDYLVRHYDNRKEQWAMCHRVRLGIDADCLVNMHRRLKNIYLEGKVKRLYDTINALTMLVYDTRFLQEIKMDERKFKDKIRDIETAHMNGKSVPSSAIFKEKDVWRVKSGKDEYRVRKELSECPFKCELVCESCSICFHIYKCTCPDNSDHYNMCKHIHAVVEHRNRSLEECSTAENTNDMREDSRSLDNRRRDVKNRLTRLANFSDRVDSLDGKTLTNIERHLAAVTRFLARSNSSSNGLVNGSVQTKILKREQSPVSDASDSLDWSMDLNYDAGVDPACVQNFGRPFIDEVVLC